jgi:hypothetical protein
MTPPRGNAEDVSGQRIGAKRLLAVLTAGPARMLAPLTFRIAVYILPTLVKLPVLGPLLVK